MNGKKASKILSVAIIALMLFSGFSVLASASNGVPVSAQGTAGSTEQVTSSGVVHHTPAWLQKIDPSIRDRVVQKSKATVDITVLTTDAGLLNKYYSPSITDEIGKEKITGSHIAVRNSVSSVPVQKNLQVSYDQIPQIAQLPGVIGIYQTEKPKPAMINNPILNKEIAGFNEMGASKLKTDLYSSPINGAIAQEQHATDAWAKGYDGTGVNVAVVDTGVDFANPDLMGQWAVDENASSPYYGWPIMWDPVSMNLMMSYFTSNEDNLLLQDNGRMPYPIFATWGESSWYSDTSYSTHAQYNSTTDSYTVTYTPFGGMGYPGKRVDPMGYGGAVNSSYISRTYYIGNSTDHIVSKSGVYHLGITKDDYLTAKYGTRVGILVVDSTTPGVYDTVYVDLNNDGNFMDDKPVNKSSPLAYADVDGDGMPDISGGLLYYISNTEGSVTGEVLNVTDGTAKLAHGDIVTDIGPYYSLDITNKLFINTSATSNPQYLPSYSDTIYQDIVTNGTGITSGSSFQLNDSSFVFYGIGIPGYNVNVSYLTSLGFSIRDLTLYYGNDTNEYAMTLSDAPGMLHYSFDAATNTITLNFDMENNSYIYAVYNMNTYSIDFNTGKISFLNAPPANAVITADYEYGLPIPYSVTYTERNGYDNFIPASGDVVAFFGDFDYGNSHGTMCASNIVGTMRNFAQGTAPGAKIIGIGDFYNSASYDAWYFAVEGYDGNVSTTDDEAQIVSNSFGGGLVNTGWSYSSRLVYDITTNYAPHTTFVAAAGNEGFGYGTVGNPGASPGVVTVGAGVNMAYRWLFGYDGDAAAGGNDWINYFFPEDSWYGDVASFSSKGPTALGTPDPDVLAVGEFGVGGIPVNSAGSGVDAVTLWAGTSLATPVTAGVLALEYEAYYLNHNNTWPTNNVAKNILTSSCDDHGYDVLEQGAGWVNASKAVDMASETTGVSADRMYWTPGGYDGESHDMFINLMRPGQNDTTTMTLTNHDPNNDRIVVVGDAYYNRTGNYTFDLPVTVAGQVVLKPDGLYSENGSVALNKSLWTTAEWNNADFMKITAYIDTQAHPDQADAYPYMNLFDWKDKPMYGGNETAFNATIIPVVNQTVIVGHNGETHAYIQPPVDPDSVDLVPGAPILVYSNGTLLDNSTGGNYTIDLSTGEITFLNATGALRPLANGEVINVTYTIYVTQSAGDYYVTTESPIDSYAVWFTNASTGKTIDWTASAGTNFTLDTSTGNLTLLKDLAPGDKVSIEYYWGTPGVYDGSGERIRMNEDLEHANLVTASIYNPGKRVDDGLVLTMYDVNALFLGANPKLYNFTVSVEFYRKTDWNWISESATSVTVPANGTATVDITASVPTNAGVGSYQGAIVLLVGQGSGKAPIRTIIPVLINVPATTFPVHFGGNVPTTSLYSNSAMQGIHGGEYTGGGDWRFFFVDVSGLSVADNKKLITMLYWSGANDDSEMYLMQAQPDPAGYSGGAYGPFTMVKVAQTKEFVGATDTLVPGSEILHADMMDGPFELAVRNWQLTGDIPYTEFHGDMGYMQTSPTEMDIYTNSLTGSMPLTVSSNINLYKGLGSAVTSSSKTVFAKQPVDPYPYTGGSYEVYLANAPNHNYFTMPANVISVKFSMYFYGSGAKDVDMGVYYDANGDGIPEPDELIIPDTETATSNNPEVGTLMFPPAGPYIINAAGYDVAAGSLYDLTITTLQVASNSPFSLKATNETIPAGTPSVAQLAWDFGSSAPTEPLSTLLLVSPGCAPYALVQPVSINFVYDDQAPVISAPSPSVGQIINTASTTISASYSDNLAGIDKSSVKMLLDGSMVYGNVGDNSVSYSASGLSDGVHIVTVSVSDLAGNTANYQWAFYVKTKTSGGTGGTETGQPPGGVPPNSTPVPPTGASEEGVSAPGMYITSPTLTNENPYTLTGVTAPGVKVSVAGATATADRFGQFSLPVNLMEGDNLVSITVTDGNGVEYYYSVGITLDTTAPQISLTNFRTVVTTPSMDITGQVKDAHGITLSVNGMPVPLYADGSFTTTVSLIEGTNTITFTATDAAGNTNTITRTVTLDNTPPAISVTAPALVSGDNSTVTITINAPDAVSLTVNGIPATSNGDGTWTYKAHLSPGGNTFYIVAQDRYGNTGQTVTDITYSAPVQTTIAQNGYSTTTTYLAGIGSLILGLIIGIIIAMLLWGGKKEEPPMVAAMGEETPSEEAAPGEELPESEEQGFMEEPEELGEEPGEEGEEIPELEETEPSETETEEEGEELDFDVGDSEPDTETDTDMPELDEDEGEVLDLDDLEEND